MLKKLGIVKSKNKSYKVFNECIGSDFLDDKSQPKDYVKNCWKKYKENYKNSSNSLNGGIFELVIYSLLVKEGITPLHLQAKIAFVPNIIFDAVIYTKENGPISLSLKTSLRERYKQADLEAVALKYVHRKSQNYLLTMDKSKADSVNENIKNGQLLGLDKAILVTSDDFNDFIDKLKSYELITPGSVQIITASSIITKERISECK